MQEEGWPLGLPLNARIGFLRNLDLSGSVSFSTLLTASPTSSTVSSSDLDTESTGSFFRDKSITLGSLIGVSSILELSQRSTRRRRMENIKDQKNYKTSRPWLFSLCSKLSTDAVDTSTTPSLGHFLEAERKAANVYRRNQSPVAPDSGDFSPVTMPEANSIFVGDHVDPHSEAALGIAGSRKAGREFLRHGNGYGVPLPFPCMCGQLIE
ncbi:hypothetical protein SLE2022_075670 [Rubroshorea leprosula]